ncbi:hypothetical protein [uncultured Methanobrevibacter sp.]|uniref:hypothetical protein n=1 Tax=uncultured Methanobrevibacter sp. TaxID=253161 RepID=UPI0025DDED5C|nr:hypothetical protein [uncultured Methanobrevibacter sp.]
MHIRLPEYCPNRDMQMQSLHMPQNSPHHESVLPLDSILPLTCLSSGIYVCNFK